MKKIKKYFFRDTPSVIGTLISVMIILFMLTGPFIARYKPLVVDTGAKLVAPGSIHWFVTD